MNYIAEILKFNHDSDVALLINHYDSISMLSMLSVTRREMTHSAFLAELLKENSFHGLGNLPMQLFIEVILGRAIKQNTMLAGSKGNPVFFTELKNAILTRRLEPSNIVVDTEKDFKDYDGGNSGRVDILAKCRVKDVERLNQSNKTVRFLNIIIENKVFANERDEQTEKYYKHFNALLAPRSKYNIYVYLTPSDPKVLDNLKEPECVCKEFVQINYQDILEGVINPLLANPELNDRARFILTEYKRSLGVSFDDVESITIRNSKKSRLRTVIMAIDDAEAQALFSCWTKYKEILTCAINEYNRDADVETDNMVKRQMFEYKGQSYSMGRIVQAVIADHVNDYKYDEMNDLFKDCTGKILKKTELEKVFNNYFCDEQLQTKDIFSTYVFSNWNKNNFPKFCAIVKDHGWYDIKEYKDPIPTAEDSMLLREFYKKHETFITTMLEVVRRLDETPEFDAIAKRSTSTRQRPSYTVSGLRENYGYDIMDVKCE